MVRIKRTLSIALVAVFAALGVSAPATAAGETAVLEGNLYSFLNHPIPASDGWLVALDAESGVELARTAVQAGGAFTFPPLPVGTDVVMAIEDVTDAPYQYVKNDQWGNYSSLFFELAESFTIPTNGLDIQLYYQLAGSVSGRLLVPDYFAAGTICADLWSPHQEDGETVPLYLDSDCGLSGAGFQFDDLPAGLYLLSFSDSEDYGEWYSTDWFGTPREFEVNPAMTTVLPGVAARNASSSPYVAGAPVTVQISISPADDEYASDFNVRPYGSVDFGLVHTPVVVNDGEGSVTFTPAGPGVYVFDFNLEGPNGDETVYSNWLWIGPPIPEIIVDAPEAAWPGESVTFAITSNPALTGTAYLWAKSVVSDTWVRTSVTTTITNGTGNFVVTAPQVVHEYAVEFSNGFSQDFRLDLHPPTVTRIGGPTRYEVAVGISQQYFPGGADTVYVATGGNFPDALGAAPAAALRDAPLLLVEPGAIPAAVRTELARLTPDKIIVTGGPASVSDAVLAQLGEYADVVTRINGPDRYEVSRQVTRDAFIEHGGSAIAYIATGATFPDALSASAAAGSVDAPVILLDGVQSTLDAATRQLLIDLGVNEIRIAGGPASVSPGIEAALRNVPGVTSVSRLTGADRFVVSGATNRAAFTSASIVFIASGYTFPDALAGAPVAGALGAPLYVIPTSCIPGYVLEDIANLGATEVRILGGPGSVTPEAAALRRC